MGTQIPKKVPIGTRVPKWGPIWEQCLSDIVFFDTHDILTIFQFDAIYRDILTIFSGCILGLNAPKFHSRSAYVDIFATKLPIYGIG
mgnify:CR=1 FL=1